MNIPIFIQLEVGLPITYFLLIWFVEMSVQPLTLEIMPDHLHLFVSAKPTATPFKIVHKLKGNTSIQLRRCFPDLKYLGYKQHFGSGFDEKV